MPYSVVHWYKWDAGRKQGSVLIGIYQAQDEALRVLRELYNGREADGQDWVCIHADDGTVTYRKDVKYMAQFEAKPGMTEVFRSKSSPGKTYTAQVNQNGIVSCGCKAWTQGWKKMTHPGSLDPYRHCAHTDALTNRLGIQTETRGQYLMMMDPKIAAAKAKFAPKAVKATGPQERFAQLVAEYEVAIDAMARLDPNEMYRAAAAVELAKYKVESYLLLLEQHGIDGTAQFEAAEAKLQAVLQ